MDVGERELMNLRTEDEEKTNVFTEEKCRLTSLIVEKDKQRALLQMQWKVMSDKRDDNAEVNSKQDRSVSSVQMLDTRNPVSQKSLVRPDNAKTGSIMPTPVHPKKVPRPEYEAEHAADARPISKRRKIKNPVMHERMKGADQQHPSNIGDLFSEGSLNPYADDPYAFD
ncbi:Synaptonemal complex protein ZEP1 [Linum perenne]